MADRGLAQLSDQLQQYEPLADVEMLAEGGAGAGEMAPRLTLNRATSNQRSKHQEVSHMQNKYDDEIGLLRENVASLELKNKKYLDIIGMTASEN